MKETKQSKSVSAIITEQIIASLEHGTIPWAFTITKPYNLSSFRKYTGLNRFLLADAVKKYDDPRFVTFNEIKKLGGSIIEGNNGNIAFYANTEDTLCKASNLQEQCLNCKYGEKCTISEEKKVWQISQALLGESAELCKEFCENKKIYVSKYYRLWNIKQTTLKDDERFKNISEPKDASILIAEDLIRSMEATGVRFTTVASCSGYDETSDTIKTLSQSSFKDSSKFYANIFRLLAFACGHKKRLDLDYLSKTSDIYSYGTIVAEMATIMLCEECGIELDYKRPAGYIEGLVKILKKDSKFIIMAGNSANRVADYIKTVAQRIKKAA